MITMATDFGFIPPARAVLTAIGVKMAVVPEFERNVVMTIVTM